MLEPFRRASCLTRLLLVTALIGGVTAGFHWAPQWGHLWQPLTFLVLLVINLLFSLTGAVPLGFLAYFSAHMSRLAVPMDWEHHLFDVAREGGVAVMGALAIQRVLSLYSLLKVIIHDRRSNGFILDRRGRLVSGARALELAFGVRPNGLVPILEFIPSPHRERAARALESLWASPCPREVSWLIGTGAVPVIMTVRRTRGLIDEYVIGRILPLVHGLQGHLFQAALDAIPLGVALHSMSGDMVWQNAAHAQLMASQAGGQLEQAAGKVPAGEVQEMELQLANGQTFRRDIYPVTDPDEGRPVAILCLTRDLTQQRESQIRLEVAGREAAAGQLASGVAHNISTLLGIISLSAELIRSAPAEEIPDRVDEIQSAVQVAGDALRGLYRGPGRPKDPERVVLLVRDLCSRVVGMISSQAALQGVEVRVIVPRQVTVLADPTLLQQVLINLAVNSLQAMPEGGVLSFAVQLPEPGRIAILISDTGPGIPPETLDRLFVPYFTTRAEGTGLGLATSLKMMEAMGGAIIVESAPGDGTVLRLELPAPSGPR